VGGPQDKPDPSGNGAQGQTPEFMEMAGKLEFNPTTDPPQFDLHFTAGGPPDPQLGICQMIGHKDIRRTEKQVDGSDKPTVSASPSQHVELKIWFAHPGKPRLTGPTLPGNGIDQLQLLRIDMSESATPEKLQYEIPAEVREKWKAMVQRVALE
jgi:hypothetical protein